MITVVTDDVTYDDSIKASDQAVGIYTLLLTR